MEIEAPRQLALAGEALAPSQVAAQNAQHDLGDQLFADADLALAGKPELHAQYIKLD
jgi:hypothetical protein